LKRDVNRRIDNTTVTRQRTKTYNCQKHYSENKWFRNTKLIKSRC